MICIQHRRAFSLLELSVVLIVIGLIAAAGITLGDGVLKSAARVKTQERLSTIQFALDSFATANGYLPCPANRGLIPTSASFGVESRTGTTCTASGAGIVNVSSSFIGGVPTRTLGLPDAYAGDSWGNKITYGVSASHVGSISSYAQNAGTLTLRYGDLTTNYALSAAATYVVLSHGPDGKGSFPIFGTAVATACGASTHVDTANCNDSDAIFHDTAYNDGLVTAQFFDDFVLWGSNITARSRSTWHNAGVAQVAPTAASDCPVGSCESWCAQCKTNMGAGGLAYNSATWSSGTQVLCSRIIINTTPCEAVCIWGGTTTTPRGLKCP